MLYNFFSSLTENYSFLNVFKYITFRTGLSVITSFIIVFIIGEPLIRIFQKNQISGPIRQDGPIDHIVKKSGTPTMGGLIIILGIFLGTFLWADLKNIYVLTVIFVSIALGLLGFIDDLLKIKQKNSRGLKSKFKLLGQIIIGLIAIYIFSVHSLYFQSQYQRLFPLYLQRL